MEQILSENLFAVFQKTSIYGAILAIIFVVITGIVLIMIGIKLKIRFFYIIGYVFIAFFTVNIGTELLFNTPANGYERRILKCNKYVNVYKEDGAFDLKISNKEYNKILDGLKGSEERISVWGKDKYNKYMEINVVLDKNLIDKSNSKESEKILEIKKYKLDKKEVPFRFKDENSFFDEQYVINEII